ncbi:hypothetical protein KIN20_031945 [Parelaphostrongylus tenuis]|uniref:Uncharacterized protein n=1 Tax=Parelaphostrongylus tenuis TaxID=148309 RepID=A0AAD5R6B8_PARTN|nr:hypothetical protein KIN20_031945 [Parelaphostrongylus tenuis]
MEGFTDACATTWQSKGRQMIQQNVKKRDDSLKSLRFFNYSSQTSLRKTSMRKFVYLHIVEKIARNLQKFMDTHFDEEYETLEKIVWSGTETMEVPAADQ